MARTKNSINYQFREGQFFGKWVVVDPTLDKSNNIRVKCMCTCGLTKNVLAYKLVRHQTTGCFKCTNVGQNNWRWKGYEDISGTYLQSMKDDAAARGLKFDINLKYLWNLYEKQERKCSLSGIPIEFGTHNKARKMSIIRTASLDRIDSSKGYVKGNLQWVHKDINMMKNHYNQKYFIEICKKVATNANC